MSSRSGAATQTDKPLSRPLPPMARFTQVIRPASVHQRPRHLCPHPHPGIPCDDLHRPPIPTLPQAAQAVIPDHGSHRVESSRGIQTRSRDSPPKPICSGNAARCVPHVQRRRLRWRPPGSVLTRQEEPIGSERAIGLGQTQNTSISCQQVHLRQRSQIPLAVMSVNTSCTHLCIPVSSAITTPTEPQHQKQSYSRTPEPEVEWYQ
jgi:hypothetical protein